LAWVGRALPIVRWLPTYRRSSLRGDLLAGLAVAALLIPQALGYARIAGVPVQIGLYAVPLALVAYAVLGSSTQLIVGPASTVAIVSGSIVADITRGDPQDAIKVTAALAIATGVVLLLCGLLRIGWVAEFLSKPIVTGFVFGLTLTIVVGELPVLIGVPKPPGDVIGVIIRTFQELDEADLATALVGGAALLLLFGGARLAPRVPWGLITLVLGVIVSEVLDLANEGVATVGEVPEGLPPLSLPLIPRHDYAAVTFAGISLALIAVAEGLAAARLFAEQKGYRVETERELIGVGASNIAAGLSSGMAVTGSLSKTATADRAGATSQVTGLVSAVLVVIVLLRFTWFFTDLPRAVLSAIVVAAVWSLIDVAGMRRYARVRRADFVVASICALAVVFFGPLPGLGIAIGISLLAIIYRASRPRLEVLGKIPREKAAWGRVRGHSDRHPVDGVLVVRIEVPLFWANAIAIEDWLLAEVDRHPDTRALVLDLEATTALDTTTVDVMTHLLHELRRRQVQLYLARVLRSARGVLERSGFMDLLGEGRSWHSISQCVREARVQTGLKAHGERAERGPPTSDRPAPVADAAPPESDLPEHDEAWADDVGDAVEEDETEGDTANDDANNVEDASKRVAEQ
jgi:high affinity sulfate transporter 1